MLRLENQPANRAAAGCMAITERLSPGLRANDTAEAVNAARLRLPTGQELPLQVAVHQPAAEAIPSQEPLLANRHQQLLELGQLPYDEERTLGEVLSALSAEDGLRCVVLRGAGEQAFAAGGDIEEFARLRDTEERALAYHERVGAALAAIRDCRHPTVALIRGHCIGGGLEIAAQCDLRLCGESARFGVPIAKRGLSGVRACAASQHSRAIRAPVRLSSYTRCSRW